MKYRIGKKEYYIIQKKVLNLFWVTMNLAFSTREKAEEFLEEWRK